MDHPPATRLGTVTPTKLEQARLELHWAVQLVAAFGDAYVEHQDDDSHSGFEIVTEPGTPDCPLLAGRTTAQPPHHRAALRITEPTLMFVDAGVTQIVSSLALAGKTLADGSGWLATTAAENGAPARSLKLRGYDMPQHAVGAGAPFGPASSDGHAEAARWFLLADTILRRRVAEQPDSSPVSGWPHHFDIATLLSLEPDKDPEEARSIGTGFLLGDDSYAEPYWYVSLWPRPEVAATTPLAGGGHWHEEGFYAAILTATEIARDDTLPAQENRIVAFLDSAFAAFSVS